MERRDIPALITVCAVALGAFAWTLRQHQAPMGLPREILFTKPLPSDVEINGFSHQESWGRWTAGHEADIHFRNALPDRFRLILSIKGFGPTIGQPVVVRCGSITREIVAGAQISDVAMDFFSIGPGNRFLKIDIADPVSPAQLRVSSDQRLLGVGIEKIALLPIE